MILNEEHDVNSLLLTDYHSTDRILYSNLTLDSRNIWHLQFRFTDLVTYENLKKVIPLDILDQIRNKKIVLMLERE